MRRPVGKSCIVIIVIIVIIIITIVLYIMVPFQGSLLRSAPSTTPVKQDDLKAREE